MRLNITQEQFLNPNRTFSPLFRVVRVAFTATRKNKCFKMCDNRTELFNWSLIIF